MTPPFSPKISTYDAKAFVAPPTVTITLGGVENLPAGKATNRVSTTPGVMLSTQTLSAYTSTVVGGAPCAPGATASPFSPLSPTSPV